MGNKLEDYRQGVNGVDVDGFIRRGNIGGASNAGVSGSAVKTEENTQDTVYNQYANALTKQDNINQYYEMAKNQEYSALLDKEVQLENAKANALKYTQNALNARGMGSQGYGSSMNSGIYNNYLNAFANAQNTYQSNVNQLNQAQRNEILEADNEDFENLTTSIVDATDRDSLNALMDGYGVKVKDGKLVKPDNMTDKDFALLQYYYIGKQNEFDSEDESYGDYTGQVYENSTNALNNITYTTSINHKTQKLSDDYGNRITTRIVNAANNGQFVNGDVIHYSNGDGRDAYLRFTTNGWQVIDKQTFKNSDKTKWKATQDNLVKE